MLRSVVHLGGAYNVCGNVNPAAEANVYVEALAADELYGTHGVDIYAVGLDVTMKVRMSEENLIKMRDVKCEKERRRSRMKRDSFCSTQSVLHELSY